jgi:hypothetical protein
VCKGHFLFQLANIHGQAILVEEGIAQIPGIIALGKYYSTIIVVIPL